MEAGLDAAPAAPPTSPAEARARADELNRRAWELRFSDSAATLELAGRARELAEGAGYALGVAYSLRSTGVARGLRHEHDEALRALGEALALFERAGDQRGRGGALNGIGSVHWRRADYASALAAHLEALRIQREVGDRSGEADSLNLLGNTYYHLGEYARALESYGRSLRLKEELGDLLGVSQCVNNIGNIQGRLGEFAQALESHLRALELKRRVDDRLGEGIALINVGSSYEAMEDFAHALEFYGAALEHARALGDRMCEADVLRNLGDVHRKLGEPQRAHEHYAASLEVSRAGDVPFVEVEALVGLGQSLTLLGRVEDAVEPLRQALERAGEIGSRRLVYEAHRALSDAYESLGDHAAALRHFRAFHAVEGEVFNQESDRRIQSIRVQAEVERTQREAELLRVKNAELTEANDALRRADEEKALLLWQLRLQAEELDRQTKEDSLTGLFNRRHMDAQLALEFERARRFGRDLTVVMADVDYFKQVNDRFSHGVGDEVLRAVGRILREHTRAVDVVGRFGGEEFVLLLVETPPEKAARFCEKLRARIEGFPWADIHPALRVTISMGLSGDLQAPTAEALLAAADAKLYEAKRAGRNQIAG